jgi:hypothetical protein
MRNPFAKEWHVCEEVVFWIDKGSRKFLYEPEALNWFQAQWRLWQYPEFWWGNDLPFYGYFFDICPEVCHKDNLEPYQPKLPRTLDDVIEARRRKLDILARAWGIDQQFVDECLRKK